MYINKIYNKTLPNLVKNIIYSPVIIWLNFFVKSYLKARKSHSSSKITDISIYDVYHYNVQKIHAK